MNDIETVEDCGMLVEAFYRAARADPLLGSIFEARVSQWPEHLERMTRFWATVLLTKPLYHGKPLERHVGLPLGPEHFARWLSLWSATLASLFVGPRAELARRAASKMAQRMGAVDKGSMQSVCG